MTAAAWTPVAVRNASSPTSGYCLWIGTSQAFETNSHQGTKALRSRSPSSPSSLRFIRVRSSEALPTRSPMPRAVPWIRSAPASSAMMLLVTPSPRSLWPCQSIPTCLARMVSSSKRVNETRSLTPSGVAWPTVSHRHRRWTPYSTAQRNSWSSTVGVERVVSSVTKHMGRPRFAHSSAAILVRSSRIETSQFSV